MAEQSKRRFGTFGGVFTPSVLTILGVIMYLRLGWVVGEAGIYGALAIIGIAHVITIISALSVSAVATNMRVETGGLYYMISRSFGMEIGGSIGFPLFLSQAISISLYVIGFTEALALFIPGIPRVMLAMLVCVAITVGALISAKIVIKIQYVILAMVIGSLVVFFLTAPYMDSGVVATPSYSEGHSFWTVFAIFFPAVTGLMAGVSMSGDLKNPSRSIPRGVLGAVITGLVVYSVLAVVYGIAFPRGDLIGDQMIMMESANLYGFAGLGLLVLLGIWGATLSSAIGQILSAPRTLQALAFDRLLPRIVAKEGKHAPEPIVAIIISFAIAIVGIALGDINTITPILTMFFLISYGMINLVAGFEALVDNPSYRPRFNIHWSISLLGAAGCFGVMFLIDPIWAAVALGVEFGIYFLLSRRSLEAHWGDLRRGFWIAAVRLSLRKLKKDPMDVKNWRPMLLVFSGDPWQRRDLVQFANWLAQRTGIITICNLKTGELKENIHTRQHDIEDLESFISNQGFNIYGEVDLVSEFAEGALVVAQANGMGEIQSNTMMFGWSNDVAQRIYQAQLIRRFSYLDKSIVILHVNVLKDVYVKSQRIDIWWGQRERNADLMLLLAYFMTLNPEWKDCDIHIKTIATDATKRDQLARKLESIIESSRIKATPEVIVPETDEMRIQDVIQKHSHDADLVFLGLAIPKAGEEEAYMERMSSFLTGLPTTLLVRNARQYVGKMIEEQ